jgi:hypothetical protein
MSMGLMVYLVPKRETAAVLGCRDEALLTDILEQMAGDIEELDEEFDTDSEEYGPGITFTQAMQELFQGNLSQPDKYCAHIYTYAFELVCRYYGEWLGNRRFVPCRTEWLEHLDDLLSRHGVPLRFHDLVNRCPIKALPYRDVFCLGHWKRTEAMRASPSLKQLLAVVQDEYEKLALENAGEWLTAAREQPGSIIVGVFC